LTTNALIAAALALGLLEPETDQQIGGEAHPFPAEEHLDEVVRRHQHQHGEGEQREIGEEARLIRVLVHIAPAIEVDERGDGGDHHQHHGGQRIDAQRPVEAQAARLHPVQHRARHALRHDPRQEARKIGQDSAQETNSAPVVSDLGGHIAQRAVAQARR
jgi:hypothetical protein